MATDKAYEDLVAEFLTANGATFIAPQYGISYPDSERGGEWSRPDFVAIRPAQKECFIVEVTTSGNPTGLLARVNSRTNQWFTAARKQLEGARVIDPSWKMEVLVFIRQDQLSWFAGKITENDGVHLWPLEYMAARWTWNPSVREFNFDLRNTNVAL